MNNPINNWDSEKFDILINKDGEFMCAVYDTPRTWEWCNENCLKYDSCDTIAWQDNEYKLLCGEAWRCPKCREIVNNSDTECWGCKEKSN